MRVGGVGGNVESKGSSQRMIKGGGREGNYWGMMGVGVKEGVMALYPFQHE